MNLKTDIIAALTAATEPLDRVSIGRLCLSGTDKQVADQLYLLKKDGAIIGEKQGSGSYLYRMPTDAERKAAQDAPWIAPIDVLRVRSEAEVDEIELERIEAEELHRGLVKNHFLDAGKMIAVEKSSDDGKQYIDVWPGPTLDERMFAANEVKSQPEIEVSETVEDAIAEPIQQEVPPFRVGVYSDETMVLEKPDEELYEIDKAEFAVMVAFARTVGWLAE